MILIDGHNAMHRLKIRADTHEGARGALLARVRQVGQNATVFFDAREAPPGLPSSTRENGVRVRYCRGEEADDAILTHIRESDRPGRFRVVTDDRELAGLARQLGAKSVSVEEFFARRTTEDEDDRPPRDAGGFSAADFDLPGEVDTTRPPGGLA